MSIPRHDPDPGTYAATLACHACDVLVWHYRRPLRDDDGLAVYVSHCCDAPRTVDTATQDGYGTPWPRTCGNCGATHADPAWCPLCGFGRLRLVEGDQ